MRSTRKQMARKLSGLLTGLMAASVLAACSPNNAELSDVSTVNTGSIESETSFGSLSKEQSVRGKKVYVASETLRLRTSPKVSDSNIAGEVLQNDVLEILDSSRIGDNEFIAVKVVKTGQVGLEGKTLYTSVKYLNATPAASYQGGTASGRKEHFIVTNVATEMVRLYERCRAPETCKNKLLMEFNGTVGNNSKGMRSDVGVYKATSWMKYYEVPGVYAGWYRPGYPDLPKVGSRSAWLSKNSSPKGFSGPRGAFGWYTVMVGPNNNGQWTHGTTGWGADKNKMVRFQDSFLGGIVDIFAKLGSHGCTRMSNEAIAFLRSNFAVGETMIKIYAKETLKDPTLQGYPRAGELGKFDYILTTKGYGKTNGQHEVAARDVVLANGTPESEWLEQGTFEYDQTPTATSGDHYKLKQFQGVFNVDEGTVSADYRAPQTDKLHYGGYPGRESAIPAFAKSDVSSTQQRLSAVEKPELGESEN